MVLRICLGVFIAVVSVWLAFYNVSKNEKKEITGPTLTLIFSSFLGLALVLNINFNVFGFDSSQFDQKIAQANSAKDEAEKASKLAEEALYKSKEVYALSLLRTGLLPSEESIVSDRKIAREILKSIYGDKYEQKIQNLHQQNLLPIDYK